MPAETSVSQLAPLAALPAASGHSAGDLVNVLGDLYVLVGSGGNNQFHGTAKHDGDYYLGTKVVDGDSRVGSFVDPAVRGEVTWVYTTLEGVKAQDGIALVRLRVLRTAFAGSPPETLYVRVVDQRGQTMDAEVTRDLTRDTSEVYAWDSAPTGVIIETQPGETFTASVFRNGDFMTGGVEVHGRSVWERWLLHQLPEPRTDEQVRELARDAVGAALEGGGADGDLAFEPKDAANKIVGSLKDGTVDAAKIDADTAAKQQAIRDAIAAEAKLLAGAGIRLGVPNAEGRRAVAVVDPQGIAGGALGAEDAFRQPGLDQDKPWRVEAIEHDAPVVVKLTLDPAASPPAYNGKFDIDDSVEAAINYSRLAISSDPAVRTAGARGKFIITTTPNSTARTLANLFANGTVTHVTIRLGATAEAARSGQYLIRLPVAKDAAVTNTLAMRTTTAVAAKAEGLLATTDVVYAEINFVVGGGDWRRAAASDLTAATIRGSSLGTSVDIGGITSDGTSLFVVDRNTFGVAVFTDGKEDTSKSLPAATVRAGMTGNHVVGMATDGTNLYILSDTGVIGVFTLAGARVDSNGTVTGTSALTYDGTHLLIGSNQGPSHPRVRAYTTGGARIPGRPSPNNLHATHLQAVNSAFHVAALAFADGVVYVGDGNTGRVRAFVARIHDATKEPPASVLVRRNMRGMTVHDGKLYVAAGSGTVANAALAFVIPRDTYGFPEGYHFTVLDQAGLRNAAAARTIAVDELPDPGTAGRQVWVRKDYDAGAVSVQPAAFADTALDGLGYGARGWWRRAEDGLAIGSILGVFDDLVLLSDSRVAIRTGSIAGISKLHVGAAEYPLSAVTDERNVKLTGAADEPAVDVYAVGGGGLPSTGAWRDVWIQGATSADRNPAAFKIEQGEYLDTGSAWSPAGFAAPPGDSEHDFRVLIEETVPGAARAQAVRFVRQGGRPGAARYLATAPFGYVSSLTFDARSTSQEVNRYLVRIPADRAVGGGIPIRIMVGALTYALTAGAAEDGVAVFRTPVVDSSVRVDDANPSRTIDVQYADRTWANGAGKRQVIRTLDRPALQRAAGGAPEVTRLPPAPGVDQRVKLVAADSLVGSGLLEAKQTAAGDFAGYYHATPADTGSLIGAPGNGIEFLGSYLQSTDARLHNRAVVARTTTIGKTPQAVWIDGRKYAVTSLAASYQHSWRIKGADGSTFVAGRRYRVQLQWTDGTRVYPDEAFAPDDYTWNGRQWVLTPGVAVLPRDLRRESGADLAGGRLVAVGAAADRFELVRGLTRVHDGTVSGIDITNTTVAKRVSFARFSPEFDLDLFADGALWSELELTINSRSPATVGFDRYAASTYREAAMATVGAIKRQAAYTSSGGVEGVAVAATTIRNGLSELGVLRLYLARNADNETGYLLDYNPSGFPGVGAHRLTIVARLALCYLPFL